MKRGKESPALNFVYIVILLVAIFAMLMAVQGFIGYAISASPGGGCIDSDGGKNYFVAGHTLYKGNLYYDVCTSSSKLKEYSCSWLGKSSSSTYTCRTGCSAGACITITSPCSDGTINNTCSTTKPKFCQSGTLINKCSTCGCDSGQSCNATSQACYTPIPTCSDGTINNTCSTTKPKFCNNGILINKCSTCGCPSGQSCNATSQACYTPETIPNAPSNLRVIAIGYTSVNLSWMDNSNNENGFDIQKSLDNITFAYNGTAYNNNSYSILGLASGTKYYFKVSAFNQAGNSAYSNVVSATTNSVIINQTCSDGTINGNCSAITPLYCQNGILISNCSICGCLSGQVCYADGTCKQALIANCSDGTINNTCSTTKPKFCQSGTLIDKCSSCGCPSGQNCNATSQVCYTPSNCVLVSSSISSSCASGTSTDCEQGEAITMSGTYTGDCSISNYYQIDAQSSDGLCKIQFSGGQISGITKQSPAISGGTITGTWTIPSISSSCNGKTVTATVAALWSGVPGLGTLVSGQDSSGSFRFSNISTLNCKYLIPYDRDGGVSPKYLATNASRIESMANFPYQGVAILATAGNDVMNGVALNPTTVSNEFAPLRTMAVKPAKLRHNLVRVLLKYPGDMFNDTAWNITAQNFAILGQALEDLSNSGFGVDGILFDNEGPYTRPSCSANITTHGFWNLPADPAYGEPQEFIDHPDCWPYIKNWGTYNITQYNDKARERGKQVMQALAASWPNVKIMFMHSSDVSCKGTQEGALGLRSNDVSYANEMLGPFAIGLAEGAYGTGATVIDGGEESYGYITDTKYNVSYNFRNSNGTGTGMTTYTYSSKLACPFIPAADKPVWPSLFEIGFALYNKASYGGGQTVSTIGTATQLSIIHTDHYVWFYTEGNNSIDPLYGSRYIGSGWMNQIITGRNNAGFKCQ